LFLFLLFSFFRCGLDCIDKHLGEMQNPKDWFEAGAHKQFFSLLSDLPTFPILSIKTVLQSESRSSGAALRDLEAVTFEFFFLFGLFCSRYLHWSRR
jgi:hypothetical protein